MEEDITSACIYELSLKEISSHQKAQRTSNTIFHRSVGSYHQKAQAQSCWQKEDELMTVLDIVKINVSSQKLKQLIPLRTEDRFHGATFISLRGRAACY